MAAKWEYTLHCIKFNTLPYTTRLNLNIYWQAALSFVYKYDKVNVCQYR